MQSFRIITPDASRAFTIGRKSDNDLVLENPMVSRNHAVMEPKRIAGGGGTYTGSGETYAGHGEINANSSAAAKCRWFLKSITQNSVTQLNGKTVAFGDEGAVEISDGDIILIGPQQLRVTLKGSALSLLLTDSAEQAIYQTKILNEKWQVLNDEQQLLNIPENTTAKISAKGIATVAFKNAVLSPSGKSTKKVEVKDGESIQLLGCELKLSGQEMICRNLPHGFSVVASHLDVFASKKQLLHDINFNLPAGEILAIIGRSGQGKSTLLRLLQGINRSGDKSKVYIGGMDYRNEEIRKHIAFLEQEPALRKDLTVRETLMDGGRVSMNRSDYQKNAQRRLEKFCELFGLSERIENPVKTLSGGEKRRAALAAELMGSPGLIILDEPLSGLDPFNAKILCTHLKQLAFLGHTVILTTHSYEALKIANKVLVLHHGEQGFYGTPENAYSYFATEDAEEILSNLNEETAVLWKKEEDRQQKSTITFAGDAPKDASNFYFVKEKHPSVFAYKVSLTFKQWFRDKGKFLALLLQPLVIGFLFSQIFSELSSLWIVAFAIILSSNWLALSLSIREIVMEKEILQGELRKGVPLLPIIAAKISLPTIVAFLQSVVVFLFVNFRIFVHVSYPLLLLGIATVVLPAVATGLLVSAFSKNAGQANALLPLLIIPQVALAGALVPLDQMLPIGRGLSYAIWSRYNQGTLLNQLLGRQDDLQNIIVPIAIAVCFYIVMAIKLIRSKKAK